MRDKRIKYDKGLFVDNTELEKEISAKAREFVISILDGIGKDYLIPDLEPLIMTAVITEISDKAITECAILTEEEWKAKNYK